MDWLYAGVKLRRAKLLKVIINVDHSLESAAESREHNFDGMRGRALIFRADDQRVS